MTINYEFQHKRQRRGCIFIFITALARIFGFLTLIGMILITFLEWLPTQPTNFRIYVTVATSIVAYLELLWVFDKCVTCCICCFRTETCFYWCCCLPIDNWVKTILYIALAIPLIIPTWFQSFIRSDTRVVGALLVFTGMLYLIKTFKYKKIDPDDNQEDDDLFTARPVSSRPSISTQTSTMGINNDQLSSAVTMEQETVKKP